jgi:hypothetical protein
VILKLVIPDLGGHQRESAAILFSPAAARSRAIPPNTPNLYGKKTGNNLPLIYADRR